VDGCLSTAKYGFCRPVVRSKLVDIQRPSLYFNTFISISNVLGRAHHDTLDTFHMLAATYHKQKNNKGAHATFNYIYTARLKALGEQHKETTFSAECLFISSKALHAPLRKRFLFRSSRSVSFMPIWEPNLRWEPSSQSLLNELAGII
jgi:hypothetical protein